MNNIITLGGVEHTVSPIPLGRLKIVLPALNRAARVFESGIITESALSDVAIVIANAIGLSQEEVEGMAVDMPEIIQALDVIAQVSGLKPREPELGEPSPVASSIGTNSTAG